MAQQHVTVEALVPIVREAGMLVLGARGSAARAQDEKTNAKDFVTVTDIKAQNIIGERLAGLFPQIQVISEEHAEEERAKLLQPDFTGFVIDPIDGTYNFKRDMRESAISIGYIEDGRAKVGVIYDPYKDELYTAVADGGAFCNGVPIKVSAQETLEGACVVTTNSYDDEAMARNLQRHLGIYEQTKIMPWTNCPGSGVLALAYVACGRFDAYHHNGLKPWDCAAAHLLVREAGGKVWTLQGDEDAAFTSPTVLAVNPTLGTILLDVFKKMDQGLMR